jgi:integrase
MAKKFVKLTRTEMRNLPAGEKLMEHGITFERLGNGDGVDTVNVMVDGERIHRVVGRESDGTTRTQAEQFIEKARQDAKAGRLNLPKGRKLTLGFADVAAKYLSKLEEEGGKDIPKKRQRLLKHLAPHFTNTPLSKISGFDVERYKKARAEAGAASGTVNRELAALSHLFNKAVEWGWLDHRPAKIRRHKEGAGRITYLTVEQIARLVEAAKHDQSPHIYPFTMIGLETGMRRMEILSIRLADIDLNRRVILIPRAKAGTREQPITASLAEVLRGYVDAAPGQGWLFPSPQSATAHVMNIEKPFRRVVAEAGLDPRQVVRHTLRHTAITHLVQAGVDLPTVKRISGHKTLAMVERYSHQNGEHIQAAMDKLERRYRKGA